MSTVQEVLAGRRMLLVRGLRLPCGESASREMLKAVMRHRGLRRLDLRGATLASLEPDLLARAVAGMEELQLGNGPVSSQQAEAIFRAVTVQTKLQKLSVSFTDLSSLEPGLLARAVVSLEEVSLRATQLTSQQVEEILEAIN